MYAHIESINLLVATLNLRIAKRLLDFLRDFARLHQAKIRHRNLLKLYHRDEMRDLFPLLFRQLVVMHKLNRQRLLASMIRNLNKKRLKRIFAARKYAW